MLTRQLLAQSGRAHSSLRPFLPSIRSSARLFTTSPLYNTKTHHGHGHKHKQHKVDPLKPPAKNILAEANVSAKEQRRADWGIIKEMSHYLWPKVCAFGEQRISWELRNGRRIIGG
jgi:hypothetical protein